MNKLDRAARSQILHLLCEGSSIRAVTRLTGASKNTSLKLMIDAGKACAASDPLPMDAEDFLLRLPHAKFDLGIFDPPYSPRQISECYKSIGKNVTGEDTQNARLYKRVRDAMAPLIAPSGVVLSFGWNSQGMGAARGFELEEILLVPHGGAHNDTICLAERKCTP